MKPLSDEDVEPLREACRIAYEQLNQVLLDRPAGRIISLAARAVIEEDARKIMRAWERIPDHFEKS